MTKLNYDTDVIFLKNVETNERQKKRNDTAGSAFLDIKTLCPDMQIAFTFQFAEIDPCHVFSIWLVGEYDTQYT